MLSEPELESYPTRPLFQRRATLLNRQNIAFTSSKEKKAIDCNYKGTFCKNASRLMSKVTVLLQGATQADQCRGTAQRRQATDQGSHQSKSACPGHTDR